VSAADEKTGAIGGIEALASACASLAQDLAGDEVDEALSPAGALDDQRARALFDGCDDGLKLAVAEGCLRTEHLAKEFMCAADADGGITATISSS
jgi:hypothetical protein